MGPPRHCRVRANMSHSPGEQSAEWITGGGRSHDMLWSNPPWQLIDWTRIAGLQFLDVK